MEKECSKMRQMERLMGGGGRVYRREEMLR